MLDKTELTIWDIWEKKLEYIDFAFQPIINIATGKLYAVEALIRNYELAGFQTIDEFFDTAYNDGLLFKIDIYLREKAVAKFVTLPFYKQIKLFFNYDPRCLEMKDYISGSTEKILENYNVTEEQFCFEISEKYKINCYNSFNTILKSMTKRGIKIAIDDFGSGIAGFELFYHSEPHYIKVDRFLITEINKDIKKKIICSQIISLSKNFGVTTIAEGIETQEELTICIELGFNLVQGYFLQKGTKDINEILFENPYIKETIVNDKRKKNTDRELIEKVITKIDVVRIDDDFSCVFSKFHDRLHFNFFPVVDTFGYPLGIIHEKDIKKYVYSPYGKEILVNKSISKSIKEFISRCPIVDINTHQNIILELFVNNQNTEGVIIVEDQLYCGFLTAKSLLNIIHEKNIKYAVEVNPLTKLPGNMMIEKFIDESLSIIDSKKIFVYFDFDHFKPFNDRFGFRQGDKAIRLFAEILNKEFSSIPETFIGHIGGDDFFAGFKTNEEETIIALVKLVNEKFTDSVACFYPYEEFRCGTYHSTDRYGVEREFELLTVSAGILVIQPESNSISNNTLVESLAIVKKSAKESDTKISVLNFSDT
ncbi:MAG: hypothetical protein A2355_06735 [Spirochaetes bacterium RIFOXYB1_FULL_32_8]|nr:MAG: hypothetical protein A2Y30_00575 [Spirochaetes bacterium GWE1_32_154]OHD51339.1 MAG: hypothetical protein A2Y29_01020 [Spirochaetes bacterium GWE2_31_10]OHD77008.1 MAG: hypothetical protein A2355_06735 [Spirochaetes bacterium RIFOXYB1_FULL_32_8]